MSDAIIHSPKTKYQQGSYYEQLAEQHYIEQGYQILERNYVIPRLGEIDLIVRLTSLLVFVEVRKRISMQYGGAAASVTPAKQRKITNTASMYLQQHPAYDRFECRFDVIAFEPNNNQQLRLNWIIAAF